MKDCKNIMDAYMNLDKGEHVPFRITWHLLTCKNCRKQIRLLRRAEESSASEGEKQSPFSNATILAVMDKISDEGKSYKNEKNPISLAVWVVFGILMLAAFAGTALIIKSAPNTRLIVYIFLELAGLIISYCALFVKSNYDFFVKKNEKKK